MDEKKPAEQEREAPVPDAASPKAADAASGGPPAPPEPRREARAARQAPPPPPTRLGWWIAFVGLFVAFVVQTFTLACKCRWGVLKMDVALALDAMVLIRIIVGLVRRDRGDVWALYLALPFLVIVVLWIVMPLVGGH